MTITETLDSVSRVRDPEADDFPLTPGAQVKGWACAVIRNSGWTIEQADNRALAVREGQRLQHSIERSKPPRPKCAGKASALALSFSPITHGTRRMYATPPRWPYSHP